MSHLGVSWKPFVLPPALLGLVGVLLGLVLVVWWAGVGFGVASSWCSPGSHWTHLSEFVRGSSLQVAYSLGKRLKQKKTEIYIYIYMSIYLYTYVYAYNVYIHTYVDIYIYICIDMYRITC